jgi:26S proteasome non-ATPase regulatory subunit 10
MGVGRKKKTPAKKAWLLKEGSPRRSPRAAMSLIESVTDNDLQACKGWIAEGADVNAVDEDGCTALWWAASLDHVECATALIDAKADVDKANNYGATPLHMASNYGHAECVRVRHLCGLGNGWCLEYD